jgi:fructose-1,6-bisphosphatase/inositol monophosphatase family enzyme
MKPSQLDQARKLLCRMQEEIRGTLLAARRRRGSSLAGIAAVTEADTIYEVDRVSERAICAWFERHWPKAWPVELVMEGLEDAAEPAIFPKGTAASKVEWLCIIDPIDGTRNLMYDKRSAWVLSALAPRRGKRTGLGDLVVAAMTELPTSKQWRSDQFSAVRGGPLHASGHNLFTGRRQALAARPSQAGDFHHGFASIVRFFPEGMELTSRLEEALWAGIVGVGQGRSPLIFSDQYISTGGQLAELISGHDRMVADLRPLVFAKLGLGRELVCHPYDICTALLLTAAGGLVEHPCGGPVKAPLDTTTPVAWVGYANGRLAKTVRPVLRRLCRELLGA